MSNALDQLKGLRSIQVTDLMTGEPFVIKVRSVTVRDLGDFLTAALADESAMIKFCCEFPEGYSVDNLDDDSFEMAVEVARQLNFQRALDRLKRVVSRTKNFSETNLGQMLTAMQSNR